MIENEEEVRELTDADILRLEREAEFEDDEDEVKAFKGPTNLLKRKPKEELILQERPAKLIPEEKRAVLRRYEVDIKKLPSQGKTYPENARIIYTEYLHQEVKQVSDEKDNLTLDLIFQLMFEGIYTKNFDKYEITFDDFLFISMLRKIVSFPRDTVSYFPRCIHCEQENIFTYKFNEFGFYDLEMSRDEILKKELFDFYFYNENEEESKETLNLEFLPLTMGNFFKLYNEKLDANEYAYLIFQCTNYDPVELMQTRFIQITSEMQEKLENIETYFNHGFMIKTENCQRTLIDLETKELILTPEGEEIPCNRVIAFEVDTSYSLVLPFRR